MNSFQEKILLLQGEQKNLRLLCRGVWCCLWFSMGLGNFEREMFTKSHLGALIKGALNLLSNQSSGFKEQKSVCLLFV